MANDPISPTDFGASFKGFMQQMASQGPAEEPFFRRRLAEHFGADPSKLTIISEKFGDSDHPNLHLAVEAFIGAPGRTSELLGIASEVVAFGGFSLAQLVAPGSAGLMGGAGPSEGPVKYTNLELNDGKGLACTQLGLYLVKDGEHPLALLVHAEREMFGNSLKVEVLAAEKSTAEACLAAVRKAMQKRNVYRGQVVSLSLDEQHSVKVHFHRLPGVSREDIILPQGLLERIERQSIGFAKHAEKLLAAKRHLKRGMLLHGPPGTGKTFTAMYLAGRMPERTVLLVTGRSMGQLAQACAMARALQPATIILEDIDLIAEERTGRDSGGTTLLFELLNQMDGLADDADILFILTTNRPEILEPALKSRPGRIDLALEVPVPDAECRRRLFELYGRGLKIVAPLEPFVTRTEGASAAFIRELFRRAALYAADGAGELELHESHFGEALHEMIMDGGPLTRSLLGFKTP
jgi:ATPase family associated with various cellular activities (AAA)